MLLTPLLGILRGCWGRARPPMYLFPGRTPDKPIEPTVLHVACRSTAAAAGFDKRVSVHLLRHSVATPPCGERRRNPRSREPVDDGRVMRASPCNSSASPLQHQALRLLPAGGPLDLRRATRVLRAGLSAVRRLCASQPHRARGPLRATTCGVSRVILYPICQT
jgi:hypothetical protein